MFPMVHNDLAMRSADFEKVNFAIRSTLSQNLFWRLNYKKKSDKTSFGGLNEPKFHIRY